MKIIILPQSNEKVPTFQVVGKILKIDDEILDFSTIPNGATVERDETDNKYFQGAEIDIDGNITLKIIFPYNSKTFEKGKIFAESIEIIEGIVNPHIEKVEV